MTLRESQHLFAKLLPRLLDKFYADGYEITLGDVWSRPEYKTHKTNSCHYLRLAIDINLFKNGTYLTDTMTHESFGIFWESLNPLCRWGGRFTKKDGGHYSITYEGRS